MYGLLAVDVPILSQCGSTEDCKILDSLSPFLVKSKHRREEVAVRTNSSLLRGRARSAFSVLVEVPDHGAVAGCRRSRSL